MTAIGIWARLESMTVELTQSSVKSLKRLRRSLNVPQEQLIEMALLEFSQSKRDWNAVFDASDAELTEEEAVELAVTEVRAHRLSKR
jgi:hypothetical protein